jgi:hypothetical protein
VLLWRGVIGVLLHPGCIQYRECTQVHFSAAVYIYIYIGSPDQQPTRCVDFLAHCTTSCLRQLLLRVMLIRVTVYTIFGMRMFRASGPTRILCSRNLGSHTSPHINIDITMSYVSVYETVIHVSVHGPSR